MLVKIVTNWSTAPWTAATGPWPACRFLFTAPRRPLSRASPALAVSTSAAAPWAEAALRGERLGDRGRRVVVRREGGLGVGEVAVAEARDRVGRDLAADVEDGSGGDARNDRGPAQLRWRCAGVVMDTP